jgi:RNase P/RNase MRP subunit p29
MSVRMACLGGVLLAGFAPADANDCLAPPSTITGQLRIVESRHPDGTPIRAFVVFVEEGQCVSIEDVDGDRADVVLSDIHLAPKDDETVRRSDAVGNEVTVQGRMGLPFTAWHGGSAMMFDAAISAVRTSSDE